MQDDMIEGFRMVFYWIVFGCVFLVVGMQPFNYIDTWAQTQDISQFSGGLPMIRLGVSLIPDMFALFVGVGAIQSFYGAVNKRRYPQKYVDGGAVADAYNY